MQTEGRLADARVAHDQIDSMPRQAPAEDVVQAGDAGGCCFTPSCVSFPLGTQTEDRFGEFVDVEGLGDHELDDVEVEFREGLL